MNPEWTSEPPGQPGPHVWRPTATAQSVLFLLTVLDRRVMALIPADGDLGVEYVRADSMGGEWMRLVPASELSAAYAEGVAGTDWKDSRANRISRGLV